MNPSEGNICGANDYENKPYLFYFDATKCFEPSLPGEECPGTTKLCVSECPDTLSQLLVTLGTNPEDLGTEIMWYVDQLGPIDVTEDPILYAAVEAAKTENGGTIPPPQELFCVKQSYASVKVAAEKLADLLQNVGGSEAQTKAADAGKDLTDLVNKGDCNHYTIPSSVSKACTVLNYY